MVYATKIIIYIIGNNYNIFSLVVVIITAVLDLKNEKIN